MTRSGAGTALVHAARRLLGDQIVRSEPWREAGASLRLVVDVFMHFDIRHLREPPENEGAVVLGEDGDRVALGVGDGEGEQESGVRAVRKLEVDGAARGEVIHREAMGTNLRLR